MQKNRKVKRIVAKRLSDTGMKDEHLVENPAIPITHVFVEFKDTRIRDRFVRSASMRRHELDERTKLGYLRRWNQKKDSKRKGWDTSSLPSTKALASSYFG